MSSQAVEDDALVKATRATEALYLVRDTYFPANPDDKIAKLNAESDLALSLLDSIPPEQRKLPAQRAKYEYLRGKILDVSPDYRKEAEDHLSKAVKLNPSLADAWLCLGNCIWKKGDLSSAKNCFTRALSKGPNKQILCQLSMLERKMAQGNLLFLNSFFLLSFVACTDNQAELVDESIQHAKEAITLDVKDGNSWYNLGNACLTSFFVTGAWDHAKLLKSLKAYQNAEKDERMKSNPDLYFNSATVNKYLENYERALTGFEAAALKDPGLNAMGEVQKIVNLLDKLDNLLRGHARSKRLASLASSLAAVNLNSSYRRATVDLLSEGLNKAVALIGKVLFFIKHENVAPLLGDEEVGPNTFACVRTLIEAVKLEFKAQGLETQLPEFQVFFNDHVANDFNTLFKAFPNDRTYMAAGVPVSPAWNKGRITYARSESSKVEEAYAAQFARDMKAFFTARSAELADDGLLAILMPCRPEPSLPSESTLMNILECLGDALADMVKEAAVDSFNLPIYVPSASEVEGVILLGTKNKNLGCSIERLEEMRFPAKLSSAEEVRVSCFHARAAMEDILCKHFGSDLNVDELFKRYSDKLEEFSKSPRFARIKNLANLFVLVKHN
ncbi:unnamed protein product [Prunus brigantina]